MKVHFYKYQGTGNDFVMIDNRSLFFPKENQQLITSLCDRRFGIGADGLILLENASNYDFRMIYYNSDGRQGTMCGNGGRCVVAFAKQLGIITEKALFIAVDGEHNALIDPKNEVQLQMKDVNTIDVHEGYTFLNTGSPHHIIFVDDVEAIDVKTEGAAIRYGVLYRDKGGSNVNFVERVSPTVLKVRTYERGVEDETYSCGTGVTAAAIAAFHTKITTSSPVELHTKGGNLKVLFDIEDNRYKNVYLCGKASFVFEGTITT